MGGQELLSRSDLIHSPGHGELIETENRQSRVKSTWNDSGIGCLRPQAEA